MRLAGFWGAIYACVMYGLFLSILYCRPFFTICGIALVAPFGLRLYPRLERQRFVRSLFGGPIEGGAFFLVFVLPVMPAALATEKISRGLAHETAYDHSRLFLNFLIRMRVFEKK